MSGSSAKNTQSIHISLKTASFLVVLIAKIESYVLPKVQGLVKMVLTYVIKGHRLNVHSVVKISILIVANSPSIKK